MPLRQKNIQKGKYSNYGSSIFAPPTSNTKYFQNIKQPTMRGSFPKPIRSTLGDEGVVNARINYNRGMELNRSATFARSNSSIDASKTIAFASFKNSTYSQSNFDGTAARRLAPEPKIKQNPKKDLKPSMHAVAGNAPVKSVVKSATLSPMLLMVAKVAAAVVIVIAIMAFVRVGITSATVSLGLNSQQIQKNIETELVNKNALEVKDSTLGNTGRIRQAAADYSLVAPASIETISLSPDVLAYDSNNNVSLVESLNRVAQNSK